MHHRESSWGAGGYELPPSCEPPTPQPRQGERGRGAGQHTHVHIHNLDGNPWRWKGGGSVDAPAQGAGGAVRHIKLDSLKVAALGLGRALEGKAIFQPARGLTALQGIPRGPSLAPSLLLLPPSQLPSKGPGGVPMPPGATSQQTAQQGACETVAVMIATDRWAPQLGKDGEGGRTDRPQQQLTECSDPTLHAK